MLLPWRTPGGEPPCLDAPFRCAIPTLVCAPTWLGHGSLSIAPQSHGPCCNTQRLTDQRGMPGRLVVDSGLDASSQYPSHDSLATPVNQLIAETRGAARGFLSYYHVLPSSHPHDFDEGCSGPLRWDGTTPLSLLPPTPGWMQPGRGRRGEPRPTGMQRTLSPGGRMAVAGG